MLLGDSYNMAHNIHIYMLVWLTSPYNNLPTCPILHYSCRILKGSITTDRPHCVGKRRKEIENT